MRQSMEEPGAVPNSAGTTRARNTPSMACDAHFHVLDQRFPTPEPPWPAGMTLDDYRLLQGRLGTARGVVVQAKYHRTDPTCLLDALARMGETGRGIAVLHPDASDGQLRRLDTAGVRGLRFSVWNPNDTVTTIAMIEPLAKRIADLGWHVQLHMSGAQIQESAALLNRLPCPIVFDHMGRLSPAKGPDDPGFKTIATLIGKGRTWVKLAGAYLNTETGPPDYLDATRIARAFIKLAPERLVWGSDWPHLTEAHKPDDVVLLDVLTMWAGDEAQRDRILVHNPKKLYGFA